MLASLSVSKQYTEMTHETHVLFGTQLENSDLKSFLRFSQKGLKRIFSTLLGRFPTIYLFSFNQLLPLCNNCEVNIVIASFET